MTQEAMDALMANVLVEEKSAAADADLIIDAAAHGAGAENRYFHN